MTDYSAMTRQELKKYVLANRHDKEAIEFLATQVTASPTLKTFTADETDRLEELLHLVDRDSG